MVEITILVNMSYMTLFRTDAEASRSEKAILGELRDILGNSSRNSEKVMLGMRNSILGMASHDLSNTKTTILGATAGA